jgi:hypothetical protein
MSDAAAPAAAAADESTASAKRRRVDDDGAGQPAGASGATTAAASVPAPDADLLAELVAADSAEAVLEVCRRHGAAKLQHLASAGAAAAAPRDGGIGVAPRPGGEPVAPRQVSFRLLAPAAGAEELTASLSATGATVTLEDAAANCDDRVLSCASPDAPGAASIPAQDAIAAAAKAAFAPTKQGEDPPASASLRLLVPKQQLGAVLGKGGATITAIRSMTSAVIKVKDGSLPSCAQPGTEEMVTVTGNASTVTLAAQRITGQLRAFQVNGNTSVIPAAAPAGPPGVAATSGAGMLQQPTMQRQPMAMPAAAATGSITERLTVDNTHVSPLPFRYPN